MMTARLVPPDELNAPAGRVTGPDCPHCGLPMDKTYAVGPWPICLAWPSCGVLHQDDNDLLRLGLARVEATNGRQPARFTLVGDDPTIGQMLVEGLQGRTAEVGWLWTLNPNELALCFRLLYPRAFIGVLMDVRAMEPILASIARQDLLDLRFTNRLGQALLNARIKQAATSDGGLWPLLPKLRSWTIAQAKGTCHRHDLEAFAPPPDPCLLQPTVGITTRLP